MDPNALLAEIEDLSRRVRYPVSTDPEDRIALGVELAEKFEDLNEWLSRGGFLPTTWRS